MTAAYLCRGLAAGLVAGLLAGLFGLIFAEPVMDRTIQYEERAGHHHEHEAVFSRAEQKAGSVLSTVLYGASVGGIFGLLSAYFRRKVAMRSEWRRSFVLAGAIFAGSVLLPSLKYPPSPPGTAADPSTLTGRTVAYLALMALGLLALVVAWRSWLALGDARLPARVLAAGMVLAGLWAFLYLALPGFEAGSGGLPKAPIRDFRLASLGTQVLLWAGIGAVFGLLGRRREEAS